MEKLIKYTKGSACARDLLCDNGFDDLIDFPLDLFVRKFTPTTYILKLLIPLARFCLHAHFSGCKLHVCMTFSLFEVTAHLVYCQHV